MKPWLVAAAQVVAAGSLGILIVSAVIIGTSGDRLWPPEPERATLPRITESSASDRVPVASSTEPAEVESTEVDPSDAVTREPLTGTAIGEQGWIVAVGTGEVVGTAGALRTFSIEVEPATGLEIADVAPVVLDALHDTERGWVSDGRWQLQRVGTPAEADIRVVLAIPETVDAYCARNGLVTNGIFSCWDGRRAMLNVRRWQDGAADFDEIETYRRYLVNHEFGHGLGMGHVECAEPGAPAPIMMQQTKSVGACVANGWPNP